MPRPDRTVGQVVAEKLRELSGQTTEWRVVYPRPEGRSNGEAYGCRRDMKGFLRSMRKERRDKTWGRLESHEVGPWTEVEG